MREWIFAYKNALAEISAPVEPAAPYRDYISWLKERDEESAINYWGDYLQGFTMLEQESATTAQANESLPGEGGESLEEALTGKRSC